MRNMRRFSDLPVWDTLVAPGVLACRDGGFVAGWRVEGLDTESMDPEALTSRLHSLCFGLSGFADPHVLWSILRRRPWQMPPAPAPGGDLALDALALESHVLLSATGVLWRDELLLFLGWKPPVAGRPLADQLEEFAGECAFLESRLGGQFGLDRLGPEPLPASGSMPASGAGAAQGCSLLAALAGLLGEDKALVPVAEDGGPASVGDLISADIVQPSLAGPMRVHDRPFAALVFTTFPTDYGLQPLAGLADLPVSAMWVTRYDALSSRSTLRKARWRQKMWRQSAADMVANIGGESEGHRGRYEDAMAEGVENTIARASAGSEGHGAYVSQILLYGPPGATHEALAPAIRTVREQLPAGFEVREERAGVLPALLSALPGHRMPNPRDVLVRARVMADLMPLHSSWAGSPVCPSPLMPEGTPALLTARARTGGLFHFNLHEGEVGHTLVFGPTGAGKSVFLGQIAAAWLRYPDARVVFFDRKRSVAHACHALGGTFLEPGGDDGGGIAPLADMGHLGTAWATDWLSELVRLANGEIAPEQRAELGHVVEILETRQKPGLFQVRELVQDTGLRGALDVFVSGPHRGVFDEDRTDVAEGLAGNRLVVFETHPLFEARPAVTLLSLDYIFAHIERAFDGCPTLVVFDEAWSFFAHDLFRARIRAWLKMGRKDNVAVLMATQSVGDAARSDITADLIESCPTKIFLANPEALTSAARRQYAILGLEAAQIDLLAAIRPRQDTYIIQPGGRRVVSFPVGPAALSLLGRTSTTESARAIARATDNPEYWKEDLEHDTMSYAAE